MNIKKLKKMIYYHVTGFDAPRYWKLREIATGEKTFSYERYVYIIVNV